MSKLGEKLYPDSDFCFYYMRDVRGRPVITVCLGFDPEFRKVVRGIAICSTEDNPCKKTGRSIAKRMAVKALKSGLIQLPIDIRHNVEFGFRSEYDAELTEFEKRILPDEFQTRE